MSVCPCDELEFPVPLAIAPGLEWLPRQTLTFPTARRHMLSLIPTHPSLRGWRARDGDDLGLMLVEMWAYLLDNLGFYDRELAQELYLGTARRRPSLRRLVELIGYRPAPPTAASATIAVRAGGTEPSVLPAGVGFRADAFDGEPPQVFETRRATRIDPARNGWTAERHRPPAFDEELLLARGDQSPAVGDVVAFEYGAPEESRYRLSARRIAAVEPYPASDGETYTRLVPAPAYAPGEDILLEDLELHLMTQTANPSPHPLPSGVTVPRGTLVLDALYPQIRPGDAVVSEKEDGSLTAARVHCAGRAFVQVGAEGASQVPVTTVTPCGSARAALGHGGRASAAPALRRLHFGTAPLGRPLNPAETLVDPGRLDGDVALAGVYPSPSPDSAAGRLLVKGAREAAFAVPGSVRIDERGRATASIDGSAIDTALRTDVTLHGNLLDLVRGETVRDERLGAADAAIPFQEFVLKKKPLTYVADSSQPRGIRPELEVRVNGLAWTRVESFAVAGPRDEVYTVRIGDDDTATIRFGGGARPASGSIVTASYRFGGGAARPPLGAIGKVVGRVAGLDRVVWSLAARGGRDGEDTRSIRESAPAAALTIGRVVSLPDFTAVSRSYPGVLAAAADLAWSTRRRRAAVTVWIISDGPSVAGDLRPFLSQQADPEVLVEVVEATAVPAELRLQVLVARRHSPDRVQSALTTALGDPEVGFLAPARLGIGRPLFRSALVKAVHQVEGVASIAVLQTTPPGGPLGVKVAPGTYLDFASLDVEARS